MERKHGLLLLALSALTPIALELVYRLGEDNGKNKALASDDLPASGDGDDGDSVEE